MQWDGIGIHERWGEYYAGVRSVPPKERMLAYGDEAEACEWAIVIAEVDRARAKRIALKAPGVLLQIEPPGKQCNP